MESHKEEPVYRRIPYESGFLMILPAANRIENICIYIYYVLYILLFYMLNVNMLFSFSL